MRLSRRAVSAALLYLCIFCLSCSNESATNKEQTSPTPPPASSPTPAVVAGPAALEGFHDIASCDGIVGWIWDKNHPDRALTVEIYDGDRRIATAVANSPRQDLVAAGRGTGKYGFTLPLPAELKDGKTHNIRVKVEGIDFSLGNTPKPVICPKA